MIALLFDCHKLQGGSHIEGSSTDTPALYRSADKALARPGRKQATATEDFDFMYPIYNHNLRNISTIYIYNKTSIN